MYARLNRVLLLTSVVALIALLACGSGCAVFGPPHAPGERVKMAFYLASTAPRADFSDKKEEGGRALYLAAQPVLTDKDIRRAAVMEGRQRALLLLEFDTFAAARLQQASAAHIGDRLVILIDDELIASSPIWAPFTQSKLYVDGGFTRQRAAEIVRRLAVPAAAPEPAVARERSTPPARGGSGAASRPAAAP